MFSPLAAPAQQPPAETYALRVDVRLVNVEVAVTDPAGNFISDLKPENFRLSENGVPQTIAQFAPTRAPVRIVLLVEASPAVFLIRRDHLTAAYHLLRGLRPEDEVALVTYARDLHSEVDLTPDKARVEQRLDGLGRFGLGMAEMRLLDAVADILDRLGPPGRRLAVLVIGTGLDTGSRTPWAQLQQRVGASQVTFFTLATGRLLWSEGEEKKAREKKKDVPPADPAFAEADARLRALAEASAGEAYFPESVEELDGIYREIAERLRNLYSLGYSPSPTARDASYREIRVELVDAAGAPLPYRVFARPGYFAPKE